MTIDFVLLLTCAFEFERVIHLTGGGGRIWARFSSGDRHGTDKQSLQSIEMSEGGLTFFCFSICAARLGATVECKRAPVIFLLSRY